MANVLSYRSTVFVEHATAASTPDRVHSQAVWHFSLAMLRYVNLTAVE